MTTLTVGAGQQYSTIHDAVAASHDGDVVQVQAGTYANDFTTIRDSISLEAVGGTVHVAATTAPADGKAIFTVGASGESVSITGFEFSGAAVADGNGAGIRYEGGALTLANTYFHDNQDGLLAASDPSGSITIRNSEFSRNGAGDGRTHNLYVNDVAQLTIDGSYLHDAVTGHEIKSRAESTTVTNSRIFDNSSDASYSIDLPNGGNATIRGNVIQQGANSGNPVIVAYGEEGGLHAGTSLVISGNTIVNDLTAHAPTLLWNASGAAAEISSNVVSGLTASQLVSGGSANVAGTTFLGSEPALDASSTWNSGSGTSTGTTSGSNTSDGTTTTETPAPSPTSGEATTDTPASGGTTVTETPASGGTPPGGTTAVDTPASGNATGTSGSSQANTGNSVRTDCFDPAYYLRANPDVAAAGMDAAAHFALYGSHEGRSPNALFDVWYYLSHNPDVAAAGVDPLRHYDQFGWHEGRDAGAQFDTGAYLHANADVAASGMNPLFHFLRYGAAEGRPAFAASA